MQTDLYNSDLLARISQLNRLAQNFQFHASDEPNGEDMLEENIIMFTKCTKICQILKAQIHGRKGDGVKYISSYDEIVTEDALNELE